MRSHWWTRGLRGLSVLMFVLVVTACGGGGGGGGDNPGGTADTSSPSVPTGLTATAVSAAQIDLSWTAATDNVGVTAYKILCGTQVTSATGTAWQNTGLTGNTQYCYTVAAVDAAGNVSTQTSQVCATTQAVAADTSAPTVPIGLTATATSASQIELSWGASTDNVGVTGYKVYRAGNEITSNASTSYQNTGLVTNTQYCYSVAAYDAIGNLSAESSEVCATTQSGVVADTTAPSVPTNLTATAVSSSQINLSWTASTDNVAVTGYTLYRGGAQLTTSTGATYQNTGLTANTQYCYTVAAQDAAGNSSAQTAQVCATTQAASIVVATHPLNDTGITTWGDYATGNALSSSPAGYPGQDADFGRDAKARAGTLIKVGGGSAGFDFTKLDSNGNALAANVATWSCVRDNVTGLIWEVKTDDGGLRDKDHTYSWYNPDPATNGGSAGAQDSTYFGGNCYGGISCNTAGYMASVNAVGLCGASDWRLPTVEELLSIVDNSNSFPAIDVNYFPNTISSGFWSSSPLAGRSDYAWVIGFDAGGVTGEGKDISDYLRLVHGGQ